jgi:hypothetical protein
MRATRARLEAVIELLKGRVGDDPIKDLQRSLDGRGTASESHQGYAKMRHRSWEAQMKRVFVAAAIVMFGIGSALAQETCESKAVSASGKPLTGAAKKSFVQKCKKDACEPKAVDSNGKPLKGAAKNSFLKKCEKDA